MSNDSAPRLAVGVISAGRVGSVLGAALARAGHRVVAASGVSEQSQRRAERLLPGALRLAPDEVVARSELILLAVPDDELPALVSGLASTGAWRSGQIVAHTSGAHGLSVLTPAYAHGALPLAMHPVMTFTGRPEDLDRVAGAAFGITTEEQFRPVAETLVLEMGAEPVWVPDAARPLYHAALSHAANHLVTLINDSSDLLAGAGVEQPTRVLAPLVEAALDNALRLSDQALTGPVSRADVATVTRHLAVLREQRPELVQAYSVMARRTADRARDSGRITNDQHLRLITAIEAAS